MQPYPHQSRAKVAKTSATSSTSKTFHDLICSASNKNEDLRGDDRLLRIVLQRKVWHKLQHTFLEHPENSHLLLHPVV
eukprot:m.56373 g.56373  ORF g.56373 m.56373 type:complete len:78 (+) comp11561_c0_seq1:651-884(+)